MKVSPILELTLILIGLWITIPALYNEFKEEFKTSDWQTWVKLSPHLAFVVAISIGMTGFFKKNKCCIDCSWLGCLVALFCTYFVMIFNTRGATQAVCEEYDSVCFDDVQGSCDTDIESWQGIMYLLGKCFLIIGGSLVTLWFIERSLEIKRLTENAAKA